ncbi:hypothetical protein Vretifemale_15730 [Volvox reticuliferus]|uniref:NADP-dependent oxidoreductase domain-containing protein n=1 Tax=Volvox reticuliferus TaxID=1737510 RepID=A0A8J4CSH3_9CHLO|nr:hypothetical protein Vretifemale_15730 [Volvox reticuliferus]
MSSWPSATRMHRVQAAGFPSTHPTEATQPGSKFAKSKPKVHFPKRCVWAGAAPSVIGNPAASASPLLPRGLKMAQLGASDLCVSEVCLGTMTWGEQNTEAEACAQLNLAAECGVNFLDTAEIYPVAPRPETANRTSTYIGNWLRHRRRHEFVIATKVTGRSTGMDWVVANRTDPPGPPSNPRLDAPSIIAAAEGELRRLRTDYIDLLQLHWPDRPLAGGGCGEAVAAGQGAARSARGVCLTRHPGGLYDTAPPRMPLVFPAPPPSKTATACYTAPSRGTLRRSARRTILTWVSFPGARWQAVRSRASTFRTALVRQVAD